MTVLEIEELKKQMTGAAACSVASYQRTLKNRIVLSGRGLHSGDDSRIILHPAGENTGILFTNGTCTTRALAHNVIDTSRGTTIGYNGDSFRTVEHLMAALRGRGVDNVVVEFSGCETPALDGSAKPIVDAIDDVGLEELDTERRPIRLTEPVCVRQNGSFILAVPASELRITYVLHYDHPMIGSQTATFVLEECDFGSEIAPARTFVLYEEVAGLLENRLARGGSLDNAIVIWQDRMSSELRFPDELVRHKVVDLVGDLSLIGGPLQAEVLAVKSGHALNVEFAKEVERLMSMAAPDGRYLEAVGQ